MLRRASFLLGQQVLKRGAASPQMRCLSFDGLVENMQEVKDSQQSQGFQDRSREVCNQRHLAAMSSEALCQVDSRNLANNFTGHAMDGNAHLESVLQTNVPEPYEASGAADNLKEGVPEGLSDTVRGRGNRWMMTEDRLNS